MGFEIVPVTTPANAREIVEVAGRGTEAAGRIVAARCTLCMEPVGVGRPFRAMDGGLYRHIVCEPLEGA